MRRVACLGLLLLGAALVPACDSDSPLQVGAQEFELFVDAPSGLVERLSVWEFGEDLDADGSPDDVDGDGEVDLTLWCVDFVEDPDDPTAAPPSASSIPWPFFTRVEVLRQGQTVSETVTSQQAAEVAISQGPYDTKSEAGSIIKEAVSVVHPAGQCTLNTSIPCDPTVITDYCKMFQKAGGGGDAGMCEDIAGPDVTRTFVFRNADNPQSPFQSIRSQANRTVLAQQTHFLTELTGNFDGFCPGTDLGDPSIDGLPQPFTVILDKGDTVIVTIGRSPTGPSVGIVDGGEPDIAAELYLDGSLVSVSGDSNTNATRNNFTFNFTTR